jgi:glycosyltransferase involved in cell wall biosynthesis
MKASAGSQRRILIIVENLPCPFDRRVWQEARALHGAGYQVTIICPKGKGYESSEEVIEGIRILRHPMAFEAESALGYLLEYGTALFWEFFLTCKVAFGKGFDVIHACNPPDTIFLIGAPFKLFGKKYVFDHHDINPELFEAKFGEQGLLYRLVCLFERWSYRTADVAISTNESYKRVAIERGAMDERNVFVVRSGPDLERVRLVPADPSLRKGRRYLVGYVGVMGKQEGIDYLLRSVQHIVHALGRRDIQFCLIGGGTEFETMRHYAVELEVADYVTFTGRIPDVPLFTALSTADVCVNPDPVNPMNDKSTMNKITEYMALGKPIVQFDLTEGRHSAQGASLYAAKNDERDFARKIVELLDDAPRREEMGRLGQERVARELAWAHQAPRLLEAYDRVFDAG